MMEYGGITTEEGKALLRNSDIVTITLGTEADGPIWRLPQSLLTKYSPFFKAAFDGGFSEAQSKSMTLPDVDIEAFELFVQWLYCGNEVKLPVHHPDLDVEAWVFGDQIQCLGFQNFGMTTLIECHEEDQMEPGTVSLVYRKTPDGSILRKYVIDHFRGDIDCETVDMEDLIPVVEKFQEFASDFMKIYLLGSEEPVRNPYRAKYNYMVDHYMIDNQKESTPRKRRFHEL